MFYPTALRHRKIFLADGAFEPSNCSVSLFVFHGSFSLTPTAGDGIFRGVKPAHACSQELVVCRHQVLQGKLLAKLWCYLDRSSRGEVCTEGVLYCVSPFAVATTVVRILDIRWKSWWMKNMNPSSLCKRRWQRNFRLWNPCANLRCIPNSKDHHALSTFRVRGALCVQNSISTSFAGRPQKVWIYAVRYHRLQI